MRAGQRLEFRGLRCLTKKHRERRGFRGEEWTVWDYTFHGPDNRSYRYSGNWFNVEPGGTIDFKATVAMISKTAGVIQLKQPRVMQSDARQIGLI